MWDKFISDDPLSLRYVLDQYKTQQMCDEAVGDFIQALHFFPDWFVYWFLLFCMQMKIWWLLAWHTKFEKCKAHKKRVKWINASNMASQKRLGLVRATRWERRNKTDFYWVMLLMYIIWEHFDTYHSLCE